MTKIQEVVQAASVSGASGAASIVTQDWTVVWLGVSLTVFFAAFSGAVLSVMFMKPITGSTRVLRLFGTVAIGTLSSVYGVRLIVMWHELSADYLAPMAFFGGIGSYLALMWLFSEGLGKAWDLIADIAKTRFGGGK